MRKSLFKSLVVYQLFFIGLATSLWNTSCRKSNDSSKEKSEVEQLLNEGEHGAIAKSEQAESIENTLPSVDTQSTKKQEFPTLEVDPENSELHADRVYNFNDQKGLKSYLKTLIFDSNTSEIASILAYYNFSEKKINELQELAKRNKGGKSYFQNKGELEINTLLRWSLRFEKRQELVDFYFQREDSGTWNILGFETHLSSEAEKRSALTSNENLHALSVVNFFIQSVLEKNHRDARLFSNPELLSNARMASLFALFDEGTYVIAKDKPVRSLFRKDTLASFLVNVVDQNNGKKSQFGLLLTRGTEYDSWKITEINFDKMVESYIKKVSKVGLERPPIAQKPEGGDIFILYFDTDKTIIDGRSKRQLDIICSIMKLNKNYKLNLSGHADSVGTDKYNKRLSFSRAETVKEYILRQGVSENQVKVSSFGESMPRRKNTSLEGRQENRRAEVFLDF